MAEEKWALRGQYMESCNCDYLCPCIYTNPQGPATHDHCFVAMGFRIDQGNYGTTTLDGLNFALVARSGKVMADGGWVFGGVVDERADPAQRDALAAILGGKAGGPLGLVHAALVSDFRGIEYKPIALTLDGVKRAASIPGIVELEIEGILSRNGSGEPYYIDNVGHPAARRLALAQAKEFCVSGFGLGVDMVGKGNNGHFAPFSWAN